MPLLKPLKITGLLTEDEALAGLEKIIVPKGGGSIDPSINPPVVVNVKDSFYSIDRSRILNSLSVDYINFLRKAGYADFNIVSKIEIAEGILRINPEVRGAAQRLSLSLQGGDGDYLTTIDHSNARSVVSSLGYQEKGVMYKVLPVGVMNHLFIPYIRGLVQQGNKDAQATWHEILNVKAEWLEDLVLNKGEIKIGSKKESLVLPQQDGFFDRTDINDFGYPKLVKKSGEFYYFAPKLDEVAAVRGLLGSRPSLSLYWGPGRAFDWLGVRVAKIFTR